MVRRGSFQLFSQDLRSPDTTNLVYDFDMISTSGDSIHFNGYKVVNSSIAFSIWETWKATSTFYVTLTASDGRRVERGILNIQASSLLSEAWTLSSTGSHLSKRFSALRRFLSYFVEQAGKSFLGSLGPLQWPSVSPSGFSNKVSPARSYTLVASDGVQTTLRVWKAVGKCRGKLLFVPGAAVDHQIFALPTIAQNAVEYFSNAGHEIWVITHRTGRTMTAQHGYTTYDARLDIRASLEQIREVQKSDDKIYIIAHCAGAIALASGLLDGTIPASWISGQYRTMRVGKAS